LFRCKPVMGPILELLLTDLISELPLLLETSDDWETGNVTESTRIERLIRAWRDGHVFLQRFLPTDVSPMHGHPWPYAHLILQGEIEMSILTCSNIYGPRVEAVPAATVYLTTGSKYEMVNRDGYHSMRCVSKECLSVMLTGPNWPGCSLVDVPPLSPDRKHALVHDFKEYFSR
jgi:hypothetical protein